MKMPQGNGHILNGAVLFECVRGEVRKKRMKEENEEEDNKIKDKQQYVLS
jgi:uncharacterized protein YeeX (DUF496 family)